MYEYGIGFMGSWPVWFNGVGRSQNMESKQKMAMAGSGLMLAGVGLGIGGAALIVPAGFGWAVGPVEKRADGFSPKVGGAPQKVWTARGTTEPALLQKHC